MTNVMDIVTIDDNEICPHGLSMWLCSHPIYHYPSRQDEMEGRYF